MSNWQTSVKPDRLVWLPSGPWPAHVAFCPSRKALDRFNKDWKIKDNPFPDKDANCVTLPPEVTKTHGIALIFINEKFDNRRDPIAIAALMLHECVHAWQFVKEDAGVVSPDHETEAYAIQHIFMGAMLAYRNTRKTKVSWLSSQ